MHIIGLDDINNRILTMLKENARASYSEIADAVGLTRVAVKNRIRDMEEMGLIRGYEVKIAPKKMDHAIEFVLNISPRPEHYDYAVGILGKNPLIHKLYAMSGDCKIYAFGVAPNQEQLDAFYRKVRAIFTEVRYFSFDIVASTYKDVDGGIEYEREQNGSEGQV